MQREFSASWWMTSVLEIALVVTTLIGSSLALHATKLMYTWGPVTFVFNNETQMQEMLRTGQYIPGNSVPFGVNADRNSYRAFLSMPRLYPGTPVALATVENVNQINSPRLVPYPDWSWHAGARGCDGLTSVFRTEIDGCDRLWVIDSGKVDILDTYEQRCPPQLVVFDLKTNEMILRHRFDIPESCRDALLLNVVVDQVDGTCDDNAYAYVADPSSFSIYVFDMKNRRSWQVSSPLFFPDVNARYLFVDHVKWLLMDGVVGLEVDDTYLYFHPLSSFQEGRVPLKTMRNQDLFADGGNDAEEDFQFIGMRSYQSAGEAMSRKRVMFFHEAGTNSLFCWDSHYPYNKFNIIPVEKDGRRLHFVSDIRIVPRNGREELWVLDNNAQRVFVGGFQANATANINVIRGVIKTAKRINCYSDVLSPE